MSLSELMAANNIDSGLTSHVVQEADGSLERFANGDAVFYMLGEGKMLRPGHPAGNQMYHRLRPLIDKCLNQHLFPVFLKRVDGSYIYKGKYSYDGFKKKTSFAGFSYFEIRMLRRERPVRDLPACVEDKGV